MKSGMSSAILASPLSSSFTGPLNKATGAGGTPVGPADVARIAAGADAAEIVDIGVEQAAVVVAHGDAQPALAEVIVGRIGQLETRELQDALVDGGERDERLLVLQVGDLDGHLDALARRHLLGRTDLDAERAQGRSDAEPRR